MPDAVIICYSSYIIKLAVALLPVLCLRYMIPSTLNWSVMESVCSLGSLFPYEYYIIATCSSSTDDRELRGHGGMGKTCLPAEYSEQPHCFSAFNSRHTLYYMYSVVSLRKIHVVLQHAQNVVHCMCECPGAMGRWALLWAIKCKHV